MTDLLIKRLRGQRLDGRSPVDCMVDAADEIESLRSRLAEAERDAARYRWLKKSNPVMIHAIAWGVAEARKFDDVDTAIDAAISADSASLTQEQGNGLDQTPRDRRDKLEQRGNREGALHCCNYVCSGHADH